MTFRFVGARGATEVINVDRFKKYFSRDEDMENTPGDNADSPIEEITPPVEPQIFYKPCSISRTFINIFLFQNQKPEEGISSLFQPQESAPEEEQALEPLVNTRRSNRARRQTNLNYTFL